NRRKGWAHRSPSLFDQKFSNYKLFQGKKVVFNDHAGVIVAVELRYNPLLDDWTMVASNRRHRPNLPKTDCPFCPGSGKVPDSYDVYAYDNDFPALMPDPSEPDPVGSSLYQTREAVGKCEVILYS